VLFTFFVLVLVSSVPSQEIGWEGRLRSDLFCVESDANPKLNQAMNQSRCCKYVAAYNNQHNTRHLTPLSAYFTAI